MTKICTIQPNILVRVGLKYEGWIVQIFVIIGGFALFLKEMGFSMRLLQARATADLHIFVWICSFVFIKGKSRKNSNNSSLKTFPPLLNKSMRQYNKDACLIYFNRTKYGNWDREAEFPIVASENLHFWSPFEEFSHYIPFVILHSA